MDEFTQFELEEARRAIISIISKSEKAREKLLLSPRAKSQVTLLNNRIKAMYIANTLIDKELSNKPH